MADDDIDIEGEFDFKLEVGDGLYDTNELPSKSANLLPEFTNPPWMLEQGWSLDNCMDEKSKATIEKMLLEEQQYLNGRKKGKYLGINKSVLLVTPSSQSQPHSSHDPPAKRQWTEEEKKLFLKGLGIYGRSWSKIAQLIPTRTTMQVKNYAQQYMKNVRKAEEQRPKSDTLKNLNLLPAVTSPASAATATITSSPITSTVALVTTAQPTIATIPQRGNQLPSRRKDKKKPAKRKLSSSEDGISYTKTKSNSVLTGAPQPVTSTQGKADSALADCLTNGLGSIPSVPVLSSKPEPELETAFQTFSSVTSAEGCPAATVVKMEKSADDNSESEDVDIDIENDDGDDNAILQSRSASPSSVYSKLLQQANVGVGGIAEKIKEEAESEHELEESEPLQKEEGESLNADGEHRSSHTEDSDDCLTQNSDTMMSSASSCKNENTAGAAAHEDEEEEDAEGKQEIKHIVNGVIAASGEVFEFPIPIEENTLNPDTILEEEKMVHAEFFDGRPLKTPERYLKIRNYILDCWKKSKPSYLNKTSVRPGLKNCGDVNCIGRIHAYLECIGAINFGCEQAAYNNPSRVVTTLRKNKHTGKELQMVLSTTKQEAMRPRKRRIRDASGHWVDEKELEGKTIEHKPEKEGIGRAKGTRGAKVVYDPFKLVPCLPFSEEKQAPFSLEVFSTALAVMDIHAHISRTEVIGMLGGQYCTETSRLTISMAVPCKSISTGMQCEMDPVSQTLASEQIEDVGMQVVGWYHSHPTFAPNPSVRDIETQQKFQYWFAKGGSHFVGIIISPYSPQNASVISDIRCLTIGEEVAKEFLCNTPYQFSYEVAYRDSLREILGPASELAEKYSTYSSRVALSQIYKSSLSITCLSKMLQSVKHRLEPPDPEQPIPGSRRKVEDVLHWLEQIFLEKFSPVSSRCATDTDMPPVSSGVLPTDYDVPL